MSSGSVLLVAEGNAESEAAFSGTALSLLTGLRERGWTVDSCDADAKGLGRLALAAATFSPDRARWRARFRFSGLAAAVRSARAARAVARVRPGVVFQLGATFAPPPGVPYVLYCDWNARLAQRDMLGRHTPVSALSPAFLERVDRREAAIYAGAARIFTISARLRESFLADYGVAADSAVVVYGGPNFRPEEIPERRQPSAGAPPGVLFVGKDFARKGGEVLLQAWSTVRAEFPAATLRIVGPPPREQGPPGVEWLGPLRKQDPHERLQMIEAYAKASVFCLPTLYEPFGLSVVEAMWFGVPCVVTRVSALPEIVADEETGFLVPPDDPGALAGALLRLFRDPDRAAGMGLAGRLRALGRFNWAAANDLVDEGIRAVLPQ